MCYRFYFLDLPFDRFLMDFVFRLGFLPPIIFLRVFPPINFVFSPSITVPNAVISALSFSNSSASLLYSSFFLSKFACAVANASFVDDSLMFASFVALSNLSFASLICSFAFFCASSSAFAALSFSSPNAFAAFASAVANASFASLISFVAFFQLHLTLLLQH